MLGEGKEEGEEVVLRVPRIAGKILSVVYSVFTVDFFHQTWRVELSLVIGVSGGGSSGHCFGACRGWSWSGRAAFVIGQDGRHQ